jgi:hypothetical protein
MILEYVGEKNNIVTVSNSSSVSTKISEGKYSVKGDDEIYWSHDAQVDGTSWIQINFLEATDIYEVRFASNGLYSDVKVQYSLDEVHWYTLPKVTTGAYRGWTGYEDLRAVFLRLIFNDCDAGFELTDWRIYGEQDFKINDQLISLVSKRLYPQRFFESRPMIPEMVTTFLQMLETNQGTIKKFFEGEDCRIEVYLVFDEGDEGSGSIDSFAINSIPINSASSTTFTGLGAAIINRVAGGGAFYDLDGNFLNPIGLRFNSLVDCTSAVDMSQVTYRWDFGDPYATVGSPSIVPVTEYGEIVHPFRKLGVYDVRFIMNSGSNQFGASQRVEIYPSPYIISGPSNPIDGTSVYTIYGLTKWPGTSSPAGQPISDGTYAPPMLTTADGTTLSVAYLIDNGDRTFSYHRNGATGSGYIKIYDEFYDEWKEQAINYT